MNKTTVIILSILLVVIALQITVLRDKIKELIKAGYKVVIEKTWDIKSDQVISKLHPLFRMRVSQFINEAEKRYGIELRAYMGLRTISEQNELYARGRTQEQLDSAGLTHVVALPDEKRVTNAKGGKSYHNYGLAVDVVQILDGAALWNNQNWPKIGKLAEEFGMGWGGRWMNFPDKPHLQMPFDYNTSELAVLYQSGARDGEYVNLI